MTGTTGGVECDNETTSDPGENIVPLFFVEVENLRCLHHRPRGVIYDVEL